MSDNRLSGDYKNKNLRQTDFSLEKIEKDILDKIMFHEEMALELRRRAGMFNTIYIPQIHLAHASSLLRKDRRLMWSENIPPQGKKSGKRHYGTIDSFEPVYAEQMKKEIKDMFLDEMNYNDEPYMKIKVIMERDEMIVQVTGNSEYSIINQQMLRG
jgi:hypothetical protein